MVGGIRATRGRNHPPSLSYHGYLKFDHSIMGMVGIRATRKESSTQSVLPQVSEV